MKHHLVIITRLPCPDESDIIRGFGLDAKNPIEFACDGTPCDQESASVTVMRGDRSEADLLSFIRDSNERARIQRYIIHTGYGMTGEDEIQKVLLNKYHGERDDGLAAFLHFIERSVMYTMEWYDAKNAATSDFAIFGFLVSQLALSANGRNPANFQKVLVALQEATCVLPLVFDPKDGFTRFVDRNRKANDKLGLTANKLGEFPVQIASSLKGMVGKVCYNANNEIAPFLHDLCLFREGKKKLSEIQLTWQDHTNKICGFVESVVGNDKGNSNLTWFGEDPFRSVEVLVKRLNRHSEQGWKSVSELFSAKNAQRCRFIELCKQLTNSEPFSRTYYDGMQPPEELKAWLCTAIETLQAFARSR